jgi:hypothetical protein
MIAFDCSEEEPVEPFEPAIGGYLGGEMAYDGVGLLWGMCVVTKDMYAVEVTLSEIETYESGVLVQKAFPDLNAEDREFIISGISPRGWAKMNWGKK